MQPVKTTKTQTLKQQKIERLRRVLRLKGPQTLTRVDVAHLLGWKVITLGVLAIPSRRRQGLSSLVPSGGRGRDAWYKLSDIQAFVRGHPLLQDCK